MVGGAKPIVIPEAGSLQLQLSQSHYVQITGRVLDVSGEPQAGASVAASAEWLMEHGVRRMIDQAKSDDQGRFVLDVHWSGESRAILIRATAGLQPARSRRRPELYAARVLHPRDLVTDPEVELVLAARTKTRGSVDLPSGSLDATRIDLALIPDGGPDKTPIYRMVSGLDNLADDGTFELIDHPNGHYRIVATHPDYEQVESYRELPGNTPISIVFTQKCRATVRIEPHLMDVDAVPGEVDWTCFFQPAAQDNLQPLRLQPFQAEGFARTLLEPGTYRVNLTGRVNSLELGYPGSASVIQVRPGKQTLRLRVSPRVQSMGQLPEAGSETATWNKRVALVPEGQRDPVRAGETPGGQPSPWLYTDALGRFRFDCPTGRYTAMVGTEAQLRAGQSSARIPVSIHAEAPHLRRVH